MDQISRRSLLKAGGAFGVFTRARRHGAGVGVEQQRSRSPAATSRPCRPTTCGTPPPTRSCAASSRRRASPGSRSSTPCCARGTATTSRCPPGLPADLVAFIEERRGGSRRGSTAAKLADGFDFYELRGSYTGLLYGLGSGIMSCAIPDEARAVYHSKGGEDMRDRVAKTAKLGYDIGTENAFDPDGEMIVTCIKTRLTHSAVRYLITSSPRWQAGGDIPAPISQRDLMITWHSLATFIHRTLGAWDVTSTAGPGGRLPPPVAGDRALPRRARTSTSRPRGPTPSTSPTRRSTRCSRRRPRASRSPTILLDLVDQDDPGRHPAGAQRAWPAYMVGTTNDGREHRRHARDPDERRSGTTASRTGGRRSSPSREQRHPLPRRRTSCTGPSTSSSGMGVLWGLNDGPAVDDLHRDADGEPLRGVVPHVVLSGSAVTRPSIGWIALGFVPPRAPRHRLTDRQQETTMATDEAARLHLYEQARRPSTKRRPTP